jgi:allene oxide cyclase
MLKLVVPATVAVLVIATLAAALVVTRSHRTAAAAAASRQLHVVEHALTDTVIDIGPKGDSLGDQLAFGNPLYDAANKARVGRDQGSCVRTVVGNAWECFWTVLLPAGQITVEGPFYDARDSVLAVTGGTGAYSAARGQMKLHARDAKGSAYDFVYELAP